MFIKRELSKNYFLLYLTTVLMSCFRAYSADLYDIDKYSFSHSEQRGIRIIKFDFNNQLIKEVVYWDTEGDKQSATFDNKDGLVIGRSGSVLVSNKVSNGTRAITSIGEITLHDSIEAKWKLERRKEHVLNTKTNRKKRYFATKEKKVRTNFLLNPTVDQDLRTKHKIERWFCEEGTNKALEQDNYEFISDKTDRKDELGKIGERVTYLTMQWAGYQSGYSKYGSNHGFDGVYSLENTMIIMETRYWTSCPSLDKLFEVCYCDDRIRKVVSSMRDKSIDEPDEDTTPEIEGLSETYKAIEAFLKQNANTLYAGGHRIDKNGVCELRINPMSQPSLNLIDTEITESKVAHLTGKFSRALDKFCEGDKEKLLVLNLCMKDIVENMQNK